MRLGRIGLATVIAAAAFAAPAQAQVTVTEDASICFEDGSTGTQFDGRCTRPLITEEGICVGGRCVSGVLEQLDGLNQLISDLEQDLYGLVPDRVCTPNLLSGPICVTG